jgi:hypothetical protein
MEDVAVDHETFLPVLLMHEAQVMIGNPGVIVVVDVHPEIEIIV